MSATTAVRQTADERRESVVAAATREFSARGYAGTSTQDIAKRVGVSQPYLFQLFGTKSDMFIAAIEECFRRVTTTFEVVARETRQTTDDPLVILHAMGHGLLRSARGPRHASTPAAGLRRMRRPGYPARSARGMGRAVRLGSTRSGADSDAIHTWFAEGMLMNVAAAVGGLNPEIEAKLKRGAY